jgi:hypothetical protein
MRSGALPVPLPFAPRVIIEQHHDLVGLVGDDLAGARVHQQRRGATALVTLPLSQHVAIAVVVHAREVPLN